MNEWKPPGMIQPDSAGVRKVVTWCVLTLLVWITLAVIVISFVLLWRML